MKVFIGVGHGGIDPGAVSVADGLKESDINLHMAIAMNDELIRHGVSTLMSRTSDENDSLAEEILEANSFAPDIAIDIHNNAGCGDGFEAIMQTNLYKDKSKKLAELCETEVLLIGQNSRGIKTKLRSDGKDYFGFLRQVKCPSIITEGAFVDSSDRLMIDTIEEQKKFGVAYAKAVLRYLGIEYKPPVVMVYKVMIGSFTNLQNANSRLELAKLLGFKDAYLVKEER